MSTVTFKELDSSSNKRFVKASYVCNDVTFDIDININDAYVNGSMLIRTILRKRDTYNYYVESKRRHDFTDFIDNNCKYNYQLIKGEGNISKDESGMYIPLKFAIVFASKISAIHGLYCLEISKAFMSHDKYRNIIEMTRVNLNDLGCTYGKRFLATNNHFIINADDSYINGTRLFKQINDSDHWITSNSMKTISSYIEGQSQYDIRPTFPTERNTDKWFSYGKYIRPEIAIIIMSELSIPHAITCIETCHAFTQYKEWKDAKKNELYNTEPPQLFIASNNESGIYYLGIAQNAKHELIKMNKFVTDPYTILFKYKIFRIPILTILNSIRKALNKYAISINLFRCDISIIKHVISKKLAITGDSLDEGKIREYESKEDLRNTIKSLQKQIDEKERLN